MLILSYFLRTLVVASLVVLLELDEALRASMAIAVTVVPVTVPMVAVVDLVVEAGVAVVTMVAVMTVTWLSHHCYHHSKNHQ